MAIATWLMEQIEGVLMAAMPTELPCAWTVAVWLIKQTEGLHLLICADMSDFCRESCSYHAIVQAEGLFTSHAYKIVVCSQSLMNV